MIEYLLYQRVQDVLHQPNHYENDPLPNFSEKCTFSAKKQPTNLNPKAYTQTNKQKSLHGTPNHVNRYSELPKPGFVVLHFAGRSFGAPMIGGSGFQSQSKHAPKTCLRFWNPTHDMKTGWGNTTYSYQAHNDGLELIYETFESQHFITRYSSP